MQLSCSNLTGTIFAVTHGTQLSLRPCHFYLKMASLSPAAGENFAIFGRFLKEIFIFVNKFFPSYFFPCRPDILDLGWWNYPDSHPLAMPLIDTEINNKQIKMKSKLKTCGSPSRTRQFALANR